MASRSLASSKEQRLYQHGSADCIFLCVSLLLAISTQAYASPQAMAAMVASNRLAWHHKKHQTENANATSPPSTVGSTTLQTTESGPTGLTQPATVLPASDMQSNTAPQSANGPILVTPSSLIDLSSAKFGKLSIDIQGGQFRGTAIDRATLRATELNIGQGSLKGLDVNVFGGRFDQFIFDELVLNTAGDMHFDPNQLLQNKVLQFTVPVQASVSASVSQDSLNKFLADPRTLEKLSVTASKRLGAIASFFGAPNTNIGVTLNEAQVNLSKGNKIVISIKANVGMAGVAVPISFDIDAVLGIKDGWVNVSEAHLTTNGQEISPQLSELLVSKINNMASWGHRSDDIQFDFSDIKVVPNRLFSVSGTALVKRLRMSRAKEDASPTAPNTNAKPGPGNQLTPAVTPAVPAIPKMPGLPGPGVPGVPSLPAGPGSSDGSGDRSSKTFGTAPTAQPESPSSTGPPTTPSEQNTTASPETASPGKEPSVSPQDNKGPDTVPPNTTRLSRPH